MKKATEMTSQELREAARTYDRVNNEGGEGYNPYHAEMKRRAHDQAVSDAKSHATTPQGKIEALYRRVELECGSVAREWGNTEEIDALQSSLYAEIDKIKTEIDAEFLGEWTLDITKTRREDWNNMVRSGKFGKIGSGRVDFVKVRDQEKAQGWTLDELKKAIKLHGLK